MQKGLLFTKIRRRLAVFSGSLLQRSLSPASSRTLLLFRVVWSVMVVFDEGAVEVAVVFEAGVFPGVADGLAFFDAVVGVAEAFGDEVLVEGVVVIFLEDTVDG